VLPLNCAARLFQFYLSFVKFPPSPPLIRIISQGGKKTRIDSQGIGADGARAIADAIRTNNSVRELGLVRGCCR
jgi:hypothetical protein